MEKKTAITELMQIVEMDYNNGVEISMKVFYSMLKEALVKERQQIEEAYDSALRDTSGITTSDLKFGSKYFTQTYQQ